MSARPPCNFAGCEHTAAEHRAFDRGVAAALRGEDGPTPRRPALREAWLNGHAIGAQRRRALVGVVAQSDLPAWVRPIGPAAIWSQFSVFYSVARGEMIEEYVFDACGNDVRIVAKAWHTKRPIAGRRATLMACQGVPPLVMVAAGIIAATIHVTLREQREAAGGAS